MLASSIIATCKRAAAESDSTAPPSVLRYLYMRDAVTEKEAVEITSMKRPMSPVVPEVTNSRKGTARDSDAAHSYSLK